MTRRDAARIFKVSETLEVTGHWRTDALNGERRVVTRIDRDTVHMTRGLSTQPTDLHFSNASYMERDDGRIRVEWNGGHQWITYRIVDAR